LWCQRPALWDRRYSGRQHRSLDRRRER
jgi:hypothetical protein